MNVTIAALDKNGDSVVERILELLNLSVVRQPSSFGLVLPEKSLFGKNVEIMKKHELKSSVAAGFVTSKSKLINNYEHLQLEDSSFLFEGRIFSSEPKTAISQQIANNPLHCEATLQTILEQADGAYWFLLIKNCWIAAGRDPIGIQPLYFGENKDLAAFATNRKNLWKLGIENPSSFPPGNIAFVNSEGYKLKPIKTLTYTQPKPITIDYAAKRLLALLEDSIRQRIYNLKKVAVAFSGGLDSSLIAFLVSKYGLKVKLIHVSLENQTETEQAIKTADILNLPLQVKLFKDSDVEKTLPILTDLIEEPDPIKVSIGLPLYWVAENAAESGFEVMIAGQGADELFGGYQRYVNEFCRDGHEKVEKTMFDDVISIHESNLERDMKITRFHDIDLRLPFVSFDLAKFAISLPIEVKIENKINGLRKLVLRKAALNAGVPVEVTEKPKKAIQYSTGINDAIKRIAKNHNKTLREYINELFEQSKKTNCLNKGSNCSRLLV